MPLAPVNLDVGQNKKKMIVYRQDKLAPTLMITCVGGATLATMVWMVGIDIFRQWYFYCQRSPKVHHLIITC